MNAKEQEIQMIVQAVAQGQDLSQFDPSALSAAKNYVVSKANELNRMVNSADTPPNVTREMLRNELTMYEGFADKLAEDDPMFAGMMDAALIGAGVYGAAKYGPMAAAKLKTAGQATYGFGKDMAGKATSAMGGLGTKAATAASSAAGYAAGATRGATNFAQNVGDRIRTAAPSYYAQTRSGLSPLARNVRDVAEAGVQGVRDFGRGVTDNFGANRIGSAPGMTGYNAPYAAGQRTYGFGKNILGGLARLGRKAFLRF